MSDTRSLPSSELLAYRLTCGHVVLYPPPAPRRADPLYCYRCTTWRMIDTASMTPVGYRVRCTQCRVSRYKTSEADARLMGETHALRQQHTVLILDHDGAVIGTLTPDTA